MCSYCLHSIGGHCVTAYDLEVEEITTRNFPLSQLIHFWLIRTTDIIISLAGNTGLCLYQMLASCQMVWSVLCYRGAGRISFDIYYILTELKMHNIRKTLKHISVQIDPIIMIYVLKIGAILHLGLWNDPWIYLAAQVLYVICWEWQIWPAQDTFMLDLPFQMQFPIGSEI